MNGSYQFLYIFIFLLLFFFFLDLRSHVIAKRGNRSEEIAGT